MEYLVQVSGAVSERQYKTYVVRSNTEEEARSIAAQNFSDEFCVCDDDISIRPDKRLGKSIIAFVFLTISIFLSLIGWRDGHDIISIGPDLISCLYSIMLYAAFVVRFKGIHRAIGSWVDIVFSVLIVLLLASFVRIMMNTGTINLFGNTEILIDTKVILPIAIILSWLGLKVVSLCCMACVLLTALLNISALNDAMGGIWGSTYIICAFLGLMLYLSVEPAFPETMFHIRRATMKGIGSIGADVVQAKGKINAVKANVSKRKSLKETGEKK